MNESEFLLQIDRLKETYGEKIYSNERIKLIWNQLKHVPQKYFENCVSDIIASSPTAPMLPKLQESLSGKTDQIQESKKIEIEFLKEKSPECRYCGNTGIIYAEEIGTIYEATFRCFCPVAEKIGNNWPIWSEQFSFRYEKI